MEAQTPTDTWRQTADGFLPYTLADMESSKFIQIIHKLLTGH